MCLFVNQSDNIVSASCECCVGTSTFVSHLDRDVGGVVVDEDGSGVVSRRLQDLLFEGAVSSLQQRHPVDAAGRDQEAGVGVAALPVHH